ncbi:MAG: hypothetical protein ACKOPS_28165, partial [Cyanobium sp.]
MELAQRARKHARDVKLALGVTVTPAPAKWEGQDDGAPDPTITKVVGELLASVGITTKARRTGSTTRMYQA